MRLIGAADDREREHTARRLLVVASEPPYADFRCESSLLLPKVELIEPYPVYLVFNPVAFRIGIAYERLVNRWAWSSRFRLILIARARAGQLRLATEGAASP